MSLLASRQSLPSDSSEEILQMVSILRVIIQNKYPQENTSDGLILSGAKRLLKIILTAYRMTSEESSRIILGHELDYKTVNDWLFIENSIALIQDKDLSVIHKTLKKLLTISEKRFPQLFFIFSKHPNFLKLIATKVCNPANEQHPLMNDCLQMLIRLYMMNYIFNVNWNCEIKKLS